ncbi:MAG: YCF48-related protein, partial [Ignavibacteriaceae bacterium]
GYHGIILNTTNGGINWNSKTIGTTLSLYSVHFTDSNTGWAVGGGGNIWKTTDGGANWNICHSQPDYDYLSSIYFIDDTTGWVVGAHPFWTSSWCLILKTTDGGISWDSQMLETQGSLRSVHFIDKNKGWAVGGNEQTGGIILKTTDGGINWSSQLSISFGLFFSVNFIDQNIGWAVGGGYSGGTIYKTTDGGTNWTNQPGNFESLSSIQFINQNTGWAVGGSYSLGTIYKTTDGGTNWIPQTSGTMWPLTSVSFTDSDNGWAVGGRATILHTTNGGVTFVEDQEIDKIPTEYNLSNNFPNPFNPSTKIKYSVPQSSKVVIKVFDILGNEIETLVNEEKDVGTYEITWYAEQLSSGVYFYKLQAGNFVETKKMVLMK